MTTLRIQKNYLNGIRSGVKTVEGRVGSEKVRSIHKGDLIRLEAGDKDYLVCEVVEEPTRYHSFEEMLRVGARMRECERTIL